MNDIKSLENCSEDDDFGLEFQPHLKYDRQTEKRQTAKKSSLN